MCWQSWMNTIIMWKHGCTESGAIPTVDGGQRNCIGLGCLSVKTSPDSGCFLSQLLSPWLSGRDKEGPLLWQAPQVTESDGSLPEGRSTGKDLFRLPKGHLRSWEGRLHGVARGPRTQATNTPPKPRATSFFPLRKLKGNQPIPKMPSVHLVYLEEEDAGGDEDQESDDPSRIKVVMEEFMVHLARAIKDAQADEKCCYHCRSPEHFIHNCPLVKISRQNKQLNGKEGMALKKGACTPPTTANMLKSPQTEVLET